MLDGGGGYQYEEHPGDWGRLPEGMTLREVADVIVDRQDRVHVLTRGPHAIIVFDASGEYLYCWGEGIFARPHGATLGEGDTLWCVDDEGHGIYHCSLAGEVLRTIGTPGQVAPAQSGRLLQQADKTRSASRQRRAVCCRWLWQCSSASLFTYGRAHSVLGREWL